MSLPPFNQPIAILLHLVPGKQSHSLNNAEDSNLFLQFKVPYPIFGNMLRSDHYIGWIWITPDSMFTSQLSMGVVDKQEQALCHRSHKNETQTLYSYRIDRKLFFKSPTPVGGNLQLPCSQPSILPEFDLLTIHKMYPKIQEINRKYYSLVYERVLFMESPIIELIHKNINGYVCTPWSPREMIGQRHVQESSNVMQEISPNMDVDQHRRRNFVKQERNKNHRCATVKRCNPIFSGNFFLQRQLLFGCHIQSKKMSWMRVKSLSYVATNFDSKSFYENVITFFDC